MPIAGWPVYNMRRLKDAGGYNVFAQETRAPWKDVDAPLKVKATNQLLLTPFKYQKMAITSSLNQRKLLRSNTAMQWPKCNFFFASCTAWPEEADVIKYVTDKESGFARPS
jgi:hypothetical protein